MTDVILYRGRAVTTSREVAARFDKDHDDFLRVIQTRLKEVERLRNFAESFPTSDPVEQDRNFPVLFPDERRAFFAVNVFPGQYEAVIGHGAVRKFPLYYLTRDAFAFFVMGFTGRRADVWKIRFIAAFNAMEKRLAEERPTPLAHFLAGELFGLLSREKPERALAVRRVLTLLPVCATRRELAERAGVSAYVARGILRRYAAFAHDPLLPDTLARMDSLAVSRHALREAETRAEKLVRSLR